MLHPGKRADLGLGVKIDAHEDTKTLLRTFRRHQGRGMTASDTPPTRTENLPQSVD